MLQLDLRGPGGDALRLAGDGLRPVGDTKHKGLKALREMLLPKDAPTHNSVDTLFQDSRSHFLFMPALYQGASLPIHCYEPTTPTRHLRA